MFILNTQQYVLRCHLPSNCDINAEALDNFMYIGFVWPKKIAVLNEVYNMSF